MKDRNSGVSLGKFCQLLGVTRQSYYQHFWQQELVCFEEELVVQRVLEIRKNHRHIGTRKLYELLQPFFIEHQIKMGRDALFDLLSANFLLVRRKKRKISTTNSYHRFKKYPNLIRNFIPSSPNQLWVSDITYWKTENGFLYISFITDAYSRKIVGYHVSQTMEAVETIEALKMAISGLNKGPDCHFQLTHHSDRGVQYCSDLYIKLLKGNDIQISMTENGDPLENAIAERINGIIKEEYLNDYSVDSIKQAKELLETVVRLYNQERPHQSVGYLTPEKVHYNNIKTEKLWKNYYQKNTIIVN
ncbi:IS3 family transposase [Flavobacterium sp. RSSA_27]|uniref:IS3 family transposase n=1 Tax=Flavobacterium sp. RSSA_27 TaxID=3447667 RepID=UPI003F2FD55F